MAKLENTPHPLVHSFDKSRTPLNSGELAERIEAIAVVLYDLGASPTFGEDKRGLNYLAEELLAASENLVHTLSAEGRAAARVTDADQDNDGDDDASEGSDDHA